MLLQNLFHIKMKMAAAVQLGPLLDGMGGTSDQPSPIWSMEVHNFQLAFKVLCQIAQRTGVGQLLPHPN